MRKSLHTLSLLLVIAAASACEIPFSLDKVSDPAFYIQFLPSPGDGTCFIVGYAEPAFGSASSEQYPLSVSDIALELDGVRVPSSEIRDSVSWNTHYLFLPDSFRPEEGSTVDLTVSGSGAPTAHASTVIPAAPEVSALELTAELSDSSLIYKFNVKFSRDIPSDEYYGVQAMRRTTVISASGSSIMDVVLDTTQFVTFFTPGKVASFSDLSNLELDDYTSVGFDGCFISAGLFSGQQPMMLLSSRQLEGRSYTFYDTGSDSFDWGDIDFDIPDDGEVYPGPVFPVDGGGENVDPGDGPSVPDVPEFYVVVDGFTEYRVVVWRLSEEFFNYAKAQYLCSFNMLSNFGVTPPNFTYTNVRGGLGVVAGCSSWASEWVEAPEAEDD